MVANLDRYRFMNKAVYYLREKMKDAEFYMELNKQNDRVDYPEYSEIPEETSSGGLNNKLARGECYEKISGILRWYLE